MARVLNVIALRGVGVQLGQMRREVAELLRNNKQENARIRVEAVIREMNMLQAYEVLEVFLELFTVRLQLLEKSKDVPNDMFECLASLVYSSSRLSDFPELVSIRGMLGHKFGKEFVEKCSSDSSCRQFMVNGNLIHCLAITAPDQDVKLQLLSEIAQEHNVEWDSHRAHQEMLSGPSHRFSGPPGTPGQSGGPPPGSFGGPPGGGGGGSGNFVVPQGPGSLYVPPPNEFAQAPASAFSANQQGDSKFKNGLKKMVTMGRKSPQPGAPSPQPGQGEEWGDASSAAAAAREYSQSAQRAADAAQRYASSNAGSTDLGVRSPDAVSPSRMRPGGPPNQTYPDVNPGTGNFAPGGNAKDFTGFSGAQQPQQPPNFTPMNDSLNKADQRKSPSPDKAGPTHYRQRTDEEIQRDFDAAPGGPPAKTVGPPSAPPPPVEISAPQDDSLGFPSPPGGGKELKKPAKGSGGIDEDLAARLAALKKG